MKDLRVTKIGKEIKLKKPGTKKGQKHHLRGIWEWPWFSCGKAHCGRGLISLFQGLLVSTRFSFWEGGWALGYHSMGLGTFLVFPSFLRS